MKRWIAPSTVMAKIQEETFFKPILTIELTQQLAGGQSF